MRASVACRSWEPEGVFQHAIVEFARNVLGIEDADHAETKPDAAHLVITPLACSLVGQAQTVTVVPGTQAARLYHAAAVTEDYYCNYGVAPAYRSQLEAAGMTVSGLGGEGEIRIVELPRHPFFLATLFLPQTRSTAARPHPLLTGFVDAATARLAARS